jgi:hypothetical protein
MRKRQSQARAERRSKTIQALGLRASGATYRQIGDALGVSEPTAWRLVQRESESMIRESASEVLELELQRLDRMLMGLWPDAIDGNVPAVLATLRIMEQRAKLLGLYDRPAQQDDVPSAGVVIIRGETQEDYIAGLRAMRGVLPLPPGNGNGHRETPS